MQRRIVEAWFDPILGHLDPRQYPAERGPAVALHGAILHIGIDLGNVGGLYGRAQRFEERGINW